MRQIWIAILVVAADRAAKILSFSLPEGGTVWIPGLVGGRFTRNEGIAFSLFGGRPWLLGALSLAVILAAWAGLRGKVSGALPRTGLMLMLGGALGNMTDRFFLGYVPDMIELLFVRFAVFNVADMALTVGCGLVIFSLLFRENQDWEWKRKERI